MMSKKRSRVPTSRLPIEKILGAYPHRACVHHASRFRPQDRADMYQEGWVAHLQGRRPWWGMVDASRHPLYGNKRRGGRRILLGKEDNRRDEGIENTIHWSEDAADPTVRDMQLRVQVVLGAMEPRLAFCLEYHYMRDHTLSELATHLGVSDARAHQLVRRAIRLFRVGWRKEVDRWLGPEAEV